MLLNFDWAGLIEKTHYPMYVNRQDIRRPDGVGWGEDCGVTWTCLIIYFIVSKMARSQLQSIAVYLVKGRQWTFDSFIIRCITIYY
jgi:hypothetical protein